jgi:hypothetical protein
MDNSVEKSNNTSDKFNLEIKETTDRLFLIHENVKAGYMFGYPAYYLNRKLLACHYGNGLALKLYEKSVTKILLDSTFLAESFSPMGRKMGKHWVIIYKQKDRPFELPVSLVEEAIEFAKMKSY